MNAGEEPGKRTQQTDGAWARASVLNGESGRSYGVQRASALKRRWFTPSADLAKQRRESALRFRDSSHFGGELRTQHSFWNRLIKAVIYSFGRHREFLWKASS